MYFTSCINLYNSDAKMSADGSWLAWLRLHGTPVVLMLDHYHNFKIAQHLVLGELTVVYLHNTLLRKSER